MGTGRERYCGRVVIEESGVSKSSRHGAKQRGGLSYRKSSCKSQLSWVRFCTPRFINSSPRCFRYNLIDFKPICIIFGRKGVIKAAWKRCVLGVTGMNRMYHMNGLSAGVPNSWGCDCAERARTASKIGARSWESWNRWARTLCSLYIGWNELTKSTATIRSPFCGYNMA